MKTDTFANRPHSKFIRELLTERGLNNKDAAKILKVTERYFNNKLYRESFSFDDILTIIYACGYTLALVDENNKVCELDFNYFPNVSEKVNDYNKEVRDVKRREYEELKTKALELKKKYNF